MKSLLLPLIAIIALASCEQRKPGAEMPATAKLGGTWHLISDIIVTKGDTVVTFPEKGKETEMIKIYNGTHFAFFQHDLEKGKGKVPFYSSGAGTYKLNGDDYAEHLAYCDAREWENHDFKFKLNIHGDTLVQKGVERIDSLNVNREIIETYVRIK